MIESMLVTCGTKAEVSSWLEALKNYVVHRQTSPSSKPVSLIVSLVIFLTCSTKSLLEALKNCGSHKDFT